MNPSIAIIVLNWNNATDTLSCLDSLARLDPPEPWIIVVDNGSSDDSVARIRAAYPGVTLLETGANLGYAGGNNVGIRHALTHGAEAVCVLNNDVTVDPGFLAPLLAALQSGPDVGIVTPLVAEQSDAGRVWALGSALNRRTGEVSRLHAGESVAPWRGREPFAVEIASGAAMLAKREVFQCVGLMDESFFLYYEEVDWCLQVGQANFRILAVPSSVVWHKVSATLGTTSPLIDYYMLRNHLRLVSRHWRGLQSTYLRVRIVLRNVLTILAYTLKSHGNLRTPHRDARLRALWDAATGHWGEKGS